MEKNPKNKIFPEIDYNSLISGVVEHIDYDIWKEIKPEFLESFPELEEHINSWLIEFNNFPKDEMALHLVRLICLHYEKFPDIINETITRINERLGIKQRSF